MGSWSETDSITQLPINHGDKCRVFFIVKNNSHAGDRGGGHSYPYDIWYPRGLPIQGTYDDYGGLENIVQNLSSKILVDSLKIDMVPYKPEYKYDKEITPDNLDEYSLMEMVERDHGYVHDTEGGPKKPLGLMFIHEDVYQAMIDYDPVAAHHTDSGFLYRKRSEILEDDMKEWYIYGLEVAKKIDNLSPKLIKRELPVTINGWNLFASHRTDPTFCKGISHYYDFLFQKMEAGVPFENAGVQEIAKGLIEYTKFNGSMIEARKFWMPQSSKGSQANETAIYKMLADTTLKICAKEDAERAEYSDDDGVDFREEHNKEELARRKNVS